MDSFVRVTTRDLRKRELDNWLSQVINVLYAAKAPGAAQTDVLKALDSIGAQLPQAKRLVMYLINTAPPDDKAGA